ncbi:MAG TPA: PIN domain-containing protein [Gemmatales bacterium]|nr:PIN domain-containing protein [Gemmatales bacterium]
MLMLDTDVLIDFQREYPPAIQWLLSLTEIPLVSGFVVMELIQDAWNRKELEQSLKLTAPLNIVWPTEEDCFDALRLFSQYHLSHRLGMIDAFIASMALNRDLTLCTFIVKHYRAIAALQWDKPYTKK